MVMPWEKTLLFTMQGRSFVIIVYGSRVQKWLWLEGEQNFVNLYDSMMQNGPTDGSIDP